MIIFAHQQTSAWSRKKSFFLYLVFFSLTLVLLSRSDAPTNNIPPIDRQSWLNGSAKQVADQPYRVENGAGSILTTDSGLKVNDSYSLKAGERGPTLLEDFLLREKLTHFDHERIPERVVHARGVGAHGYFQAYQNFSRLTRARFLQDAAIKTPVFVRFSTVAGSRGSSDTVRDIRGFATRFYTEEGNLDIVGNNAPVFFIQDAVKFPDLIHSVKPEPQTEVPQAGTAHDTAWDFFSLHEETTAAILWAMSDRAIPRSLRTMQGFGVHTFLLVNSNGEANFIKWHWKPIDGLASLVWDEAQKIAGKDPDFHRNDLYNSIRNGHFPRWELGVQIVHLDHENCFNFDILDPTKLIPEELIPVTPLGMMTLNRLPDNYFAETEQISFHLGNIVPGIDFSNDPLLQGRLFSYVDTQLARHRTPNHHQLPINRPLVQVRNNYRDSFMQMNLYQGQSSYYPNSIENNFPRPASPTQGFQTYPSYVGGIKIRSRSQSFVDYYSQATLFWNSQTPIEQQHIVDAFRFELGKVKKISIRQKMIDNLSNVDVHLARRVAANIDVSLPPKNQNKQTVSSPNNTNTNLNLNSNLKIDRNNALDKSPSLSLELYPKNMNLANRNLAVLASPTGVNSSQLSSFISTFSFRGASIDVISTSLVASVAPGYPSTQTFATTSSVLYDGVFIPDGTLLDSLFAPNSAYPPKAAIQFIIEAYSHGKPIGALGDALRLLKIALGDDARFYYSEQNGLLTSTSNSMDNFNEAFARALVQGRFWSRFALDDPNF